MPSRSAGASCGFCHPLYYLLVSIAVLENHGWEEGAQKKGVDLPFQVDGAALVAKRIGTYTLDNPTALGEFDHGPTVWARFPSVALGQSEQLE